MWPLIQFENHSIVCFAASWCFQFVPEPVILSDSEICGSHLNNIISYIHLRVHCVWPWHNVLCGNKPGSNPLHHTEQNIRISTDNLVIPWIRFHKALTCKELTPAKKNPASLTGMKGAENAATYKRLHISSLYRVTNLKLPPGSRSRCTFCSYCKKEEPGANEILTSLISQVLRAIC